MHVLPAKIGFVLLATIGCFIATRGRSRLDRLSTADTNRLLAFAFVLCRIVPFVVIYGVLDLEPRSDVPVFYDAATHALNGEVVYRDFWSPYSPLFSYLMALPLLLWSDVRMIVLLMISMEAVAWWLTYRHYRSRSGAFPALLYMLLPAPFVFSVLGGQEDCWMWCFGIGSLLLWRHWPDPFRQGVWWAVALLATKALTAFVVLALLAWMARPRRFLLGLAVVGVPALLLMLSLTGSGILTPLSVGTMRFAANGWTILGPLIGDFMPYAGVVSSTGLVALLGVSLLGGWQLRRARVAYEYALPILWLLIYGTLMLVHKSSFGNYVFIYALPLVFTQVEWQNRRDVGMLLLLSATAAIHPTLWWAMDQPIYTSWRQLQNPAYAAEYALGLAMLAGVSYFVRKAYRQTVKRQAPERRVVLTYQKPSIF